MLCLYFKGSSTKVQQTPSDLLVEMGQQSKIQCSHSIQSYDRILWYKQLQDSTQLILLGYMFNSDGYPKEGAGVLIEGGAQTGQTCTLTIEHNKESSKYFCAASSTVTERSLCQYKNAKIKMCPQPFAPEDITTRPNLIQEKV